jgi:hypothetical protein
MSIPRKPTKGHESLRDIKLRNQSSMDLYAALWNKPRVQLDIPAEPKARAPKAADNGQRQPLESEIQSAIVAGLRMHSAVGMVERINSGTATETNADGSRRFVHFHYIYPNHGGRMRAVDLSVTLKNGKRFVVEVKRPPWSKPRDTREHEQSAYIDHVIACGGYGMFATSWDQVSAELARITGRQDTR